MVTMTEMPKDFQPCASCGHAPDEAKRYAWLAGCLDDHEVHGYFDLSYLEQRFAHVWPDQTYSAVRIEPRAAVDELVLAWLDAAHAGKTPRHPRENSSEIIVDTPILHRHVDEGTGDVTVTYSFDSA